VGAGSLALLAALQDSEVEQILFANSDILAEKYDRPRMSGPGPMLV